MDHAITVWAGCVLPAWYWIRRREDGTEGPYDEHHQKDEKGQPDQIVDNKRVA
jgi:hypothetical protein